MIDLKIDLPENFLDEEVRAGHLVTKEMKEIWAVELDLLAEFQRVCKKYDIKYFANAGTFLGAIRHQGIIPWDDDIDISMLREDYEKLCDVASSEFKYPYFWQVEETDKGSLRGHAQLRNSLTTGILNSELKAKKSINQGIFIDIFPYDSVIEDEKKFKEQKDRATYLKKQSRRLAKVMDNYRFSNYSFPKNILSLPAHLYYKYLAKPDYDAIYKSFEEECAKYNNHNTEMISCLSFSFDEVHFQYREDYDEMQMVTFEFLEMSVPKNTDRALRRRFGDYQKFVKGGSYHGGVLFDTDKSYLEYLK